MYIFQKQKRFLVLLFLLCFIVIIPCANSLFAQTYNFERYSLPEGLSQSQVLDIKQDTLGRIWLATERGGVTILSGDFPSYLGRNDSLPGTTTLSLFYDQKHRMWIGTNRGVRYYNGKVLVKIENGEILDTVTVYDIVQRSDGIIVFATNYGVYAYNDSIGCYNLIPQLANTIVTKITARTNNLLYLISRNNPLLIFDGINLEELRLPVLEGTEITDCFFDSQDRIWVSTTDGLITRDGYDYKTYSYDDGLIDDHIACVAEDRFGNIWVGTDAGGLNIFTDEGIINITAQQGIGHNCIKALYCDNYKNMWVGTDGAGAYVFKGFRFTKFETPEFIETVSITAVYISSKNKIFLGTNGYGLLYVDGGKRKLFNTGNGLRSNIVHTIVTDKNEVAYIGTDKGLDIIRNTRIDKKLRNDINVTYPTNTIFIDNNGSVWIGTAGYGLINYSKTKKTRFSKNKNIAGNTIYDILQNQQGEIAVATDEGLSIISESGVTNYTYKHGLPAENITSLIVDKNNKLWLVSEKGVSRFEDERFYNIPLESITDANIIYSIVNDLFGNLLIGTERGIDIITLDNKSNISLIKKLRREDGFFGIECNLNSVMKGERGEVFFGTKQGVTIFNSLADSVKNPVPPAYIRDVELYYSKIDWLAYTDSVINWSLLPYNLKLPYNENNVTFFFGANDYQTPQKLMFQFRLEGFDQNWITPTSQRFINYTNLPPGKYSMKVRSWYSADQFSNNPGVFQFEILKPLWFETWFILASIVLLLTSVLVIWNWRLRVIRRNERRLEGIVNERTLDLQKQKEELHKANIQISQSAQMKEQFVANTSHEIRTPLNVISGYTNLLINTKVDNVQNKYLNYIKESLDNLKVIVNDILDFSKIEADKLEFESIPFDFVKSINFTCNQMEIEAAKKALSLELNFFNILHSVVVGDPVRLNQIVSNLVRNAIKFTQEGKIEVNISDISNNSDTVLLKLVIKDSGIGIPAEKLDKIFDSFSQVSSESTRKYGGTGLGLSIVKRLVDRQDGYIYVESEENKGSQFTVVIPYEKSDANPAEDDKLDYAIFQHTLSKNVKVLLVDDNQINLALAESTLTSYSTQFEIQTALNGKEAVELVQKGDYDVVIMDIQMPEMDGYTATKIIREQLPSPINKVPILGMTAHALSHERKKCLQYGMNEYIAKPFVPRMLFEHILKLTETTAEPIGGVEISSTQTMPTFILIDPIQLWKNSAGKIDRFVRYIEMYSKSIPDQIIELGNGIKNGNNDEIKLLSHTLKTSFRYLGMGRAQELAFEIEKTSMDNIPIDYTLHLKEIGELWDKASVEINAFIEANMPTKT